MNAEIKDSLKPSDTLRQSQQAQHEQKLTMQPIPETIIQHLIPLVSQGDGDAGTKKKTKGNHAVNDV